PVPRAPAPTRPPGRSRRRSRCRRPRRRSSQVPWRRRRGALCPTGAWRPRRSRRWRGLPRRT
ncbi:unnamed protein product, partial [Prorocentrum cordatum]